MGEFFKKEEVDKIKLVLSESIKFKRKKQLLDDKENAKIDRLLLAKTFISIYDIFLDNLSSFDDETREKVQLLLAQFEIKELRNSIEDYGSGNGFSSYILGERIKDFMDSAMEKIVYLLNLFYKCLEEDI